jgi:hypothetical protein
MAFKISKQNKEEKMMCPIVRIRWFLRVVAHCDEGA